MRGKYREARRRYEEAEAKAALAQSAAQDGSPTGGVDQADGAGSSTGEPGPDAEAVSTVDAAGPAAPALPPQVYKRLSGLKLDREGGARIEYASRDSTVVKVHLTVTFRTARLPLGLLQRRARRRVGRGA